MVCTLGGGLAQTYIYFTSTAIYFQHIIPTLLQQIEKDKYDGATDKWEGRVRERCREKRRRERRGAGVRRDRQSWA